MAAAKPSPTDTWDATLPGPPSRNNFGSSDLSASGLLAFASGSSVSVVDSRSLQLVSTIPLPPPPGALSPFVTSVRWIPLPLPRDLLSSEPSASHLLLAVADRHGRVALVDFHLRSVVVWLNPSSDPKLGVQDLCWVQARRDTHVLASISGSSFLSIYTNDGVFWKYDSGSEFLSCLRRDPYDSRHFCVLGLKGFLLSIKVLGDTENDVVIQEMQINTDSTDLLRLEREAATNGNGNGNSSPASAAFPLYFARFAFSPHWKNILFVTFPRELLVFDLQYETPLSSTPLPRGCAKFMDVLPDPNKELLYCAHLDGRLSIWRRQQGEQVHVMCTMEEFLPSIGMSIPSPSALAILLSQSDSTMQTITKLHPDGTSSVDFDNPFDFYDESLLVSKTTFISLSDDGKIWKWVLSAEGVEDVLKNVSDLNIGSEAAHPEALEKKDPSDLDEGLVVATTSRSRGHISTSSFGKSDLSFKISLDGQLQLLSSTVSTLAVPSPSLTATLARGGNIPAAAIPLVALGTQNGTIDVVDVSTNAVAASTSVHTGVVRGLRWLGNSRLVSFSYSQVNDKSRGYINKLVVTCLRSGLNKPFRDLQKPERTPIRALRTSSSGRYLLILFRDAPVEVWAMTKHPVMLRSLALPFTVVEWTLPAVPRPVQSGPSKQFQPSSEGVTASADSKSDGSHEETVESFAFALVNGALGVFEVQGRRIRDFRPKWPSTSFVPSDGLVTAMAYRLPHVVMGDRSGNIRWWDVTTGQSSAFNSHRDGVRRIKFSPVVAGDRSRGRVAVLFNDNTFSVYDLDSPDPVAQSLLQPQIPGTLVLELDWLPLRTDKNDPLVLCIAGADSTFRLVEVIVNEKKGSFVPQSKSVKERFRSSLSNWNPRDDSPCHWSGVSCGGAFSSVTSVDLSDANLAGPFPSLICRLPNLSSLSLYNNSINSTLPLDIGACKTLKTLDLSQNLLTGELPHTLADLPLLTSLDLTGNNFSGDIPASFSRFEKLEVLSLVFNLLDGAIPPLLGNITSLKMLNLSYNPFSPGRIPPELGNLTNLEVLWLTECNLIGQIPDSLSRLTRLVDLDLALNDLVGPIPRSLGGLTSVVQIELYNNSLTGSIPRELGNLKSLRLLDASMNQLTGSIPDELCRVPLESLNLYENNLEGELPASIASSPNLYELRIFGNRISGELPRDLGLNSPLKWLDVSDNEFSGELPPDLCSKGELEELLIIHNSFSGAIPESLGDCRSLTRVRLAYNRFSGQVPAGFWGLPHVYLLELINNSFSGEIAKTIGGAANLSLLILTNNEFTGGLPEEIGSLNNLNQLSASGNKLSGFLPESLMNLGELSSLDLQGNRFSGELSPKIKSWKKLNELNLAGNQFSGSIPNEIGSLSVLNYLDLSGNLFSGEIPVSLQGLKLNQLNLSNNRLTGDIPPSLAKEMYKNSFLGNPGLCGDIKGLCGYKDEAKSKGYVWLLRSIFVLAAVVFVAGLVWFYFKYSTFKKARAVERSKWTVMSFHKLGFSENEILESLDEDNVIGAGSSGKVYKVVLTNGETVAVKRLWTGGSVKETGGDSDLEKGERSGPKDEAFEAEVETLGKIRHKNIVKLWCCCTTRDCKLLVYEYMPNGSLGDLLHSSKGGTLGWETRFKIILDAAEGLSYLHHDCVPPIVHRDVKSNNILIDGDYGARVADFGVAKVVDLTGKAPKSMSVIAGSCGYIAPEYAYTLRVNEKSDIYSFGVVILEIVTRKRPIAPELGEKDLVKWVCSTLDQKGVEHVIDPKLDSCFKEEISKILNIGLLCTSPLPINRPSMRRVVKMLQEIGGVEDESRNKTREDKDGKLTPYYNEEASDQGSVA